MLHVSLVAAGCSEQCSNWLGLPPFPCIAHDHADGCLVKYSGVPEGYFSHNCHSNGYFYHAHYFFHEIWTSGFIWLHNRVTVILFGAQPVRRILTGPALPLRDPIEVKSFAKSETGLLILGSQTHQPAQANHHLQTIRKWNIDSHLPRQDICGGRKYFRAAPGAISYAQSDRVILKHQRDCWEHKDC